LIQSEIQELAAKEKDALARLQADFGVTEAATPSIAAAPEPTPDTTEPSAAVEEPATNDSEPPSESLDEGRSDDGAPIGASPAPTSDGNGGSEDRGANDTISADQAATTVDQ